MSHTPLSLPSCRSVSLLPFYRLLAMPQCPTERTSCESYKASWDPEIGTPWSCRQAGALLMYQITSLTPSAVTWPQGCGSPVLSLREFIWNESMRCFTRSIFCAPRAVRECSGEQALESSNWSPMLHPQDDLMHHLGSYWVREKLLGSHWVKEELWKSVQAPFSRAHS